MVPFTTFDSGFEVYHASLPLARDPVDRPPLYSVLSVAQPMDVQGDDRANSHISDSSLPLPGYVSVPTN